ncbi:hypothetical protein [Streptomyces liangshanensis]|uniref:XRE family transcriptional regulator n=1 Tax=Streptomyces liangshanensis TaxID=2717324 RepID=A0A6G9H689_9ACTN|nr:hypothetical protein [Streptomyces liangshanensis]QIQ06055.1 hypothetical protein HA039_30450 [Streptomyces liangshanensis]
MAVQHTRTPPHDTRPREPRIPAGEPGHEGPDREAVRLSIGKLLDHDRRHGPEQVADAALALWRNHAHTTGRVRTPHLATEAEIAQVAGWLLFHADRQGEAHRALLKAAHLARLAGEPGFRSFVLDLLSMHAVETGDVGEAVALADAVLSSSRASPRLHVMAHVRKARAYAIIGERARALREIDQAKVNVLDSVAETDPDWSRWIDLRQVATHETEILARVGHGEAALERLVGTSEAAGTPLQRLTSLVAICGTAARLTAWREVGSTTQEIAVLLPQTPFALPLARFRRMAGRVDRSNAPVALKRLVRHVADGPTALVRA